MMYRVVLYRTENGNEPVSDYLRSLPVKLRKKVIRDIVLLEQGGPSLREPKSKPIGDGIFELRSSFASDASRVLYFFITGRTIVLTNGFLKRTDKTPRAELERARRYRKDFFRRTSDEGL